MFNKTKFAILTATTLAVAAPASAEIIGEQYLSADDTIAETAMKIDNLSTLVTAVQATGYADELNSDDMFTVFAPIDAAFAALPSDELDSLMLDANREALAKIVQTHVVPGAWDYEKVASALNGTVPFDAEESARISANGDEVVLTALSGELLNVGISGDTLYVRDPNSTIINVIEDNIAQSNGYIHVVDQVLMPTS